MEWGAGSGRYGIVSGEIIDCEATCKSRPAKDSFGEPGFVFSLQVWAGRGTIDSGTCHGIRSFRCLARHAFCAVSWAFVLKGGYDPDVAEPDGLCPGVQGDVAVGKDFGRTRGDECGG